MMAAAAAMLVVPISQPKVKIIIKNG